MGWLYSQGLGVEQDDVKALEYYEHAGAYGHRKVYNNAAQFYLRGRGCEQSYAKAMEYYEKAVQKKKAKELCKKVEPDFSYSDSSDLEDFPEIKARVLKLLEQFREK